METESMETESFVENPDPDPDWLACAVPEPILQPALPIIDAHHHLWLAPYVYDAAEYLRDIRSGHNVTHTILVEGGPSFYAANGPLHLRSAGEAAHMRAVAEIQPSGPALCAGIVAYTDLRDAAHLPAALDVLAEAAGGRLRGIRNSAASHPDPRYRGRVATNPPDLLQDPAMLPAIRLLGERGLVYESWLFQDQIAAAERLAAQCKETVFVIDHFAGPLGVGAYRAAGHGREPWARALANLSELPNVRLKLSGLGMRALGADFRSAVQPPSSEMLAESWRPLFAWALSKFGPERCMFASNFPVDKGQFGFAAVWNAFKRLAAAMPEDDRDKLFSGTARQVYRIPMDYG